MRACVCVCACGSVCVRVMDGYMASLILFRCVVVCGLLHCLFLLTRSLVSVQDDVVTVDVGVNAADGASPGVVLEQLCSLSF